MGNCKEIKEKQGNSSSIENLSSKKDRKEKSKSPGKSKKRKKGKKIDI